MKLLISYDIDNNIVNMDIMCIEDIHTQIYETQTNESKYLIYEIL